MFEKVDHFSNITWTKFHLTNTIFRHNERRNKNYSNKNINKEKSYLNYSLKSPQFTYGKEFGTSLPTFIPLLSLKFPFLSL